MSKSDAEFVVVRCVYFKPSGKFYAEGKDHYRKSLFGGCIPCYPRECGKILRNLKRLPGLEGGSWNGPFVVEVVGFGGYMELVLPDETPKPESKPSIEKSVSQKSHPWTGEPGFITEIWKSTYLSIDDLYGVALREGWAVYLADSVSSTIVVYKEYQEP